MNQLRKIRQSALQYIYAAIQNEAGQFSAELLWEIALEKDRDHYRRALAKMICHLARRSQDGFRLLEERAEAVIVASEGDLTSSLMRDEISRYLSQSSKFESALIKLGHALVDKRVEDGEELQACCADVMFLAGIIKGMADEVKFMLSDRPAYRAYSEPLTAIIRRRSTLCEQIVLLGDVENLPQTGENKALIKAAQELAEIRPAAEELACKALAQRERWEKLITPLLTNYSLDRLDVLDKCILFLMLHELKVSELPMPVIVSEATALADSFSGGKSAPFIHGILAAASKVDESQISDQDL